MASSTLVIPARFCGPPRSAHGGYVAGHLARALEGAVSVRLVAPPPLEVPLGIESSGAGVQLRHEQTLIAEAKPASLELELPSNPGFERAVACSQSFVGLHSHPFPGCFVCGPAREGGDGLRIFAGALDEAGTLAAPWTPDSSLADATGWIAPEFVWAAVDCPGGFAVFSGVKSGAAVLGELCARVVARVRSGERCVVLGWPLGSEGKKHFAGTAIFGQDGRLVVEARATWFEVSPSQWG